VKKKVIAICGSTRSSSSNLHLIKAIAALSEDLFDITIFKGLDELPHFNPDLDNGNSPDTITAFREQLNSFDGILICTPEYAMGVPGTLKNAIDWTVSSMEFSQKPTALITASSLGQNAHDSLMKTLRIIEANITDETQLVIPHVKTKVSEDSKITDEKTSLEIQNLLNVFHHILNQEIG